MNEINSSVLKILNTLLEFGIILCSCTSKRAYMHENDMHKIHLTSRLIHIETPSLVSATKLCYVIGSESNTQHDNNFDLQAYFITNKFQK